ncbi:MAG: bacterial transcriptional activator domain-containing protein [bacterium]|nr:bacterial transcriptional activator domain-containing protein [bacterium]
MAFPLRDSVLNVSLESFREKSKGKKVVLIYPWINYRNLFLSYFLESAREGLLYYRITAEQTTLSEWLYGMIDEFDHVLGKFGARLRDALATGDPVAIGKALASELSLLKIDPITLFIDELDRLPMDEDFNRFMAALVKSLPGKVQIAFSSRLLNYQPWIGMVERGEAIVLGTEYRRSDVMFTVEATPRPQIDVYALGRGHVLANGQPITNWDGALPRNLFFYFMDHPLVTRDEIFKAFWPELSVKEATNVFHVTKRKITERVSSKVNDGGNYEVTQYNAGFYLPSDKLVRHYDVEDFQDAVERSISANTDREVAHHLTRAIDLYKAPFLSTIEMAWVVQRRDQLRGMYAKALIGMGKVARSRREDDRALGFFMRALKEVPEREDVHRDIMQILMRQNRFEEALDQYRRLEQMLHDRLSIEPSRESRELYVELKGRLSS